MKKILFMIFPSWGRKNILHFNSTDEFIVLAPDEIIKLLGTDYDVDVVSLTDEKIKHPLMRSRIVPKRFDEINFDSYDIYWHMFRDPTQPEVLERINKYNLDYKDKPVINNVSYLKHHNKFSYLPILYDLGIGPKVYKNHTCQNTLSWEWSKPDYGTKVCAKEKIICSPAYNNNRGDYIDRKGKEHIFSEYIDNAADGMRSFFRVGYAYGGITSGWLYVSSDEHLMQKSGICKHQVPFSIPSRYHESIKRFFNIINIDVCHFEGMFLKDQLYLFDVNPYPTAHGKSLTVITNEICSRIKKIFV